VEEKRGFRLITSFFLVNLSLSKIQVNQVLLVAVATSKDFCAKRRKVKHLHP